MVAPSNLSPTAPWNEQTDVLGDWPLMTAVVRLKQDWIRSPWPGESRLWAVSLSHSRLTERVRGERRSREQRGKKDDHFRSKERATLILGLWHGAFTVGLIQIQIHFPTLFPAKREYPVTRVHGSCFSGSWSPEWTHLPRLKKWPFRKLDCNSFSVTPSLLK